VGSVDEGAGGTAGNDVDAEGGDRLTPSTEPLGAPAFEADHPPASSDPPGTVDAGGDALATDGIVDLPSDADLPVALGEEPGQPPAAGLDDGGRPGGADDGPSPEGSDDGELDEPDQLDDDGGDLGELDDDDRVAGRRNALPRRVESWRSRSATGAIATALAMGLQQVFEPEKRRPAAVAEAPSNPYADDDPITVDYVPDDAPSTTVHVKPWLLEKGDPL